MPTTGVVGMEDIRASATPEGSLEHLVHAVAVEPPHGLRIGVVSPPASIPQESRPAATSKRGELRGRHLEHLPPRVPAVVGLTPT